MKKYINRICCLIALLAPLVYTAPSQAATSASQLQSCGCDHTISTYNWVVDGNTLGTQPGDTICLDASVSYANMTWRNIHGTQADPIVVKNYGGQAYINSYNSGTPNIGYGWRFKNSSFFKITGNGDAQHEYGIKVSTPGGFYISMESFTTNFEISNVEVAGISPVTPTSTRNGFAGIGIKTKPYCDGSADRGTWTMNDVKVHDNYIHDVGGEGLYIGYGFYDGRVEHNCGAMRVPHAIRGLRVFNNKVEDVGYDGIQVKNADTDVEIYSNFIARYGLRENGNHDEGMLIGDGTEALIYNNWIDNGPGVKKGNGMQINAFGNTKIFNNVVVNLGQDATQNLYNKRDSIYINNNSPAFSNDKQGTFKVYNNTFIGAQNRGIEAYTPQHLEIKNNIFTGYVQASNFGFLASLTNASNIFNPDATALNFVDVANHDFHLQQNSPAVGAGVDTQLTFDHDDLLRVDNNFDIGAYEEGGVAPGTIPTLAITTPASILHTTRRAIFVEVELTDPANTVDKVQYILNGRLIGTDKLPRKTEHWIGGQRFNVGSNDFYAIALDASGQTIARSPSIDIIVN